MADYVIRYGGRSAQGVRPNNEDKFVADLDRQVFLVADGMGGQDLGERASELAAEIIPRAVADRLAADEQADQAVRHAMQEANQAIVEAGRSQPMGRRMGTTAVLALHRGDCLYVAGLGDSRAYIIRGDRVEQLTVDHSVAEALVRNGTLTREQARNSPWQHVLHKFLGCVETADGPEVRPFTPQAGDRLVLATDGLTNFIGEEDFCREAQEFRDPQAWADHLVEMALQRGSRDNVTCIVVAFDKE